MRSRCSGTFLKIEHIQWPGPYAIEYVSVWFDIAYHAERKHILDIHCQVNASEAHTRGAGGLPNVKFPFLVAVGWCDSNPRPCGHNANVLPYLTPQLRIDYCDQGPSHPAVIDL